MRRAAIFLTLLAGFLIVAPGGLAQTATSTPTAQRKAAGTREDPIPRGQSAVVGDWRIEIVGYRQNANEIIAAIPLNDPPSEGRQFVMATFKLIYMGTGTGNIFHLNITPINPSASASDAGYFLDSDECQVVPDDPRTRWSEVSQVPPGGAVKENICWSVKTGDVKGLLISADELSSGNGASVFFDPRKP